MGNLNIIEEKAAFIINYPEYKADIEHFFTYLSKYCNYELGVNINFFGAITSNTVKDCLVKLCEEKVFKTKSKANFFIHALAKFFNILLSKEFENETLSKELKYNFDERASYYKKLTDYIISEPGLEEVKSFSPLDTASVKILIDCCNELIERRINYTKGSEAKIFGQMSAALAVKLIIFSGASYSTIRLLNFIDLNAKYGILAINGIQTNLPPELSYQFREYAKIYIGKGLKKEESKLFVGKNGAPWGPSTPHSGIPVILRAALGSSSIREINRYAILQHIDNGMTERIILKLTGEKGEALKKCYKELQKKEDNFSLVNSILVKNEIFSKL